MRTLLAKCLGRLRTSRLGAECGVTMVEIMITVVITGVIAAMAAPGFMTTIERVEFRGEARELVSMLRQARSDAITQKRPHGVYFNPSKCILTRYREVDGGETPAFSGLDSVLQVDTVGGVYAFTGTSFPNACVVFEPNGAASSSGTIFLLNYDSDGVSYSTNLATFSVLASTGRVRMDSVYYY